MWYDVGTIAVTNNSTTVTGTGTDFISGAQVGEALYINDDLYEIAVINSSTQLTLADPYLGSTASGLSYKIIPTQSLVADLSAGVADLIADFADVRDYAGNGKFNDGTEASPAITFTQDQNNGLYRIGSDNWGLVAGGDKQLEIKTTGVKLDDNKKITFGASDDLQIYHDGSNSWIKDTGTGNLRISASNYIQLQNDAGTQTMALFNDGGNVSLRYAGAEKLATTSTGVDVTGTVTADGLTVDGDIALTAGDKVKFNDDRYFTPENNIDGAEVSANGNFTVKTGATPNKSLVVGANGDVSFYEDTGTTAKFVWDASAESLGIGTSPSAPLHVRGGSISTPATASAFISNATSRLVVNHANEYGVYVGYANSSNDAIGVQSTRSNGVTSPLLLNPYGGNVGIGTASPSEKLEIAGGNIELDSGYSLFLGSDSNVSINSTSSTRAMRFQTGGSERARIDAFGNLLVGTTTVNASGSNVAGVTAQADGRLDVSSTVEPLDINRISTDGTIVNLRKDGSTVGSIGTYLGDLTVGNEDTGLLYHNEDNAIKPWHVTANLARNGVTSLGDADHRFKDLYLSGEARASKVVIDDTNGGDIILRKNGDLSVFIGEQSAGLGSGDGLLLYGYSNGTIKFYPQAQNVAEMTDAGLIMSSGKGVYLGGTGSANKLDDYEEGTWTPTNAGDATGVVDGGTGYYIKVGQMVTLIFGLDVTTGFTSNKIGGLPFPQAHSGMGSTWGSTALVANDNDDIVSCSLQSTVTGIQFHNNGNIGNQHQLGTGGNNRYYRGYITYRTNA